MGPGYRRPVSDDTLMLGEERRGLGPQELFDELCQARTRLAPARARNLLTNLGKLIMF